MKPAVDRQLLLRLVRRAADGQLSVGDFRFDNGECGGGIRRGDREERNRGSPRQAATLHCHLDAPAYRLSQRRLADPSGGRHMKKDVRSALKVPRR
jgi:hypothetical protein